MDNKILTTANKYIVTYHPFLTYDQFVDSQKFVTKGTLIDPSDRDKEGKVKMPDVGKIPTELMFDFNKLLVKFLVVKIIDAKGSEVVREPDALPLPPGDGNEIMEALNILYAEALEVFDKKKVMK